MKTCFKCRNLFALTEFYTHPNMLDGHLNKCKKCTRSDARIRQSLKRDYIRAYEKRRSNLPHRIAARAAYRITAKGRAAMRRGASAWIKRNPEKRAAQIIFSNAIRDGKIQRQSCEVCNAPSAQGHHFDYSMPLAVRWLCPLHHAQAHKGAA